MNNKRKRKKITVKSKINKIELLSMKVKPTFQIGIPNTHILGFLTIYHKILPRCSRRGTFKRKQCFVRKIYMLSKI
jgi:hypothetical protein